MEREKENEGKSFMAYTPKSLGSGMDPSGLEVVGWSEPVLLLLGWLVMSPWNADSYVKVQGMIPCPQQCHPATSATTGCLAYPGPWPAVQQEANLWPKPSYQQQDEILVSEVKLAICAASAFI